MEEYQVENWKKIKVALEEAGKTDCFFYKRAAHISKNGADIPGCATTDTPEVCPTRSSRTRVRSTQVSNAHNR